jgi:hypothetical protein
MLAEEPGFVDALRTTAQLFRRAIARPFLTLGVTLLISAGLVGLVVLKEHQFAPRVVLRVVEMDRDPNQAPRLKRQLKAYVQGAVFTSRPLSELIEKYRIYPGLYRKNPRAALDSFREDIDVDVYQNFFIEERTEHDAPRTARVAIRYRSSDRELAPRVTRDLAKLLVDHEARFRREQSRKAAQSANHALELAERDLAERRAALGAARERVGQNDDHRAEVELVALVGSLPALEARVNDAARAKAAFDLGAAVESSQLGLLFQEVDGGGIPASEGLDRGELILLGAALFAGVLPLIALGVGAFAPLRRNPNQQGAS